MTLRQTAPSLGEPCAATPVAPAVSNAMGLTGMLLMAGMVLSWSSGFIGYRYAAEQGGIYLATFWRFVIAGLLLLPFAARELRQLRAGDYLRQGLTGAFAFVGYIAPIALAIASGVTPGTTAVIANLLPLTIVVMAGIVPGQRTQGWQWLGLALCLLGMLIASASSIQLDGAPGWAYLLPVAAVLSMACVTLYQKGAPVAPMSGFTSLFIQVCAAVLLFAVLALYEGGLQPIVSTGFGLGVVWLALSATLGGYGFYWLALQRFSMQRISGALFMTPPVTMLWSWVQFGDSLSISALLGVMLTLIGLPFLSRRH